MARWAKKDDYLYVHCVYGLDKHSKDPRPEDVALICPQRGLVNFELNSIVYWSGGIMECWSSGVVEKPKPETSLGSPNPLNVWP